MDDAYKMINQTLVSLINEIWELEEKAIITDEFKDLTNNDMHVIEAVGLGDGNNMSSIARKLNITVGSLTTAMNSLVKKGYIRKIQSPSDRREFHLEVTQKYIDYYNISSNYMSEVMDRIMARFSPEDCGKLEEILTVVSRELMPEVPLPERTEE